MKISEQARKAASEWFVSGMRDMSKEVQQVINDHERDLVEAAEKYWNTHYHQSLFRHKPTESQQDAVEALKAALDRRRE